MEYKIAYFACCEDKTIKDRSVAILNDFFADDRYDFDQNASVLFIASGGSENFAIENVQKEKDVILLCHRENNSFAAAMEIASFLRNKEVRVSFIDVFAPKANSDFKEVIQVNRAIASLYSQKAALIGEVSDWLINSDIEDQLIKSKLGVDLVRLPWSGLGDYNTKTSSEEFLNHFSDFDPTPLQHTAKVYSLLDEVIKEYQLSAISVECFSMVKRDRVTACLPLAVLNKRNIVAACEGDICSLIGKMILRSLTQLIPWQANVAEIQESQILFAHCTAPLNLLSSFNITTHFETNVGTAIQGAFKKGKVGAFRINTSLDQYMLIEGEVIETPKHSFACRTQIEFATTKDQTDLLKNKALGNHHLIFPAIYIPLVERMMDQLQVKRVV